MVQARGDIGVVHKLIYELRYNYGYTYLDRCGATINDILRSHPGWVQGEVNPQGGTLEDQETRIRFHFSCLKLDLAHEQSPSVPEVTKVEEFAKLADEITKIVTDRLGIEEFNRMGFRVWRLFEQSSLEDARTAVKNLGLISMEKLQSFNLGQIDEVSFTFVANRQDTMARIAIAPVQQSIQLDPGTLTKAKVESHKQPKGRKKALIEKLRAKKRIKQFPQFALLVDVDNFIEEPPYPSDLIVEGFIVSSYRWSTDFANQVVSSITRR